MRCTFAALHCLHKTIRIQLSICGSCFNKWFIIQSLQSMRCTFATLHCLHKTTGIQLFICGSCFNKSSVVNNLFVELENFSIRYL